MPRAAPAPPSEILIVQCLPDGTWHVALTSAYAALEIDARAEALAAFDGAVTVLAGRPLPDDGEPVAD